VNSGEGKGANKSKETGLEAKERKKRQFTLFDAFSDEYLMEPNELSIKGFATGKKSGYPVSLCCQS
jgi:hypothetical protein